jgi:Fic family protein
MGVKGACFDVIKMMSQYVWDIVHLEGNPYTLPEVQTLLGGTTVGGYSLMDQIQVLNQEQAIRTLLQLVKSHSFSLTKDIHCQLHEKVAKEEALVWGEFRSSQVRISGTEHLPPGAQELSEIYAQGFDCIRQLDIVVEQAFVTFLFSAVNQFFFDGNKRTGRLMMNGLLLSHGYRFLSVPGARKDEYDRLMVDFYDSKDGSKMMEFLFSCAKG